MKLVIRHAALIVLVCASAAGAQPAEPDDAPLTRSDVEARAEQRFNADNENGDGFLSGSEIPRRILVVLDTNKDKKVSLAELVVNALAHFEAVDANHDGVVTSLERAAAKAALAAAPPAAVQRP